MLLRRPHTYHEVLLRRPHTYHDVRPLCERDGLGHHVHSPHNLRAGGKERIAGEGKGKGDGGEEKERETERKGVCTKKEVRLDRWKMDAGGCGEEERSRGPESGTARLWNYCSMRH